MPPAQKRSRSSKSLNVDQAEIEATYDRFAILEDLPQVLAAFQRLCSLLDLKPAKFPTFFTQLKKSLRNYRKAKCMCDEIYSALKARGYVENVVQLATPTDEVIGVAAEDTEYVMDERPAPCDKRKVFIVGGGPSGLRMAIESHLLGAKVIVVEMRTDFTRYNIAYVWQQAVDDLIGLQVRHFCKDFCSGSHNTISIRQLQFVLLKLALVLGVEFHSGVTFEGLIEPTDEYGWRAQISPSIPQVDNFEFDVIVDASGKRNSVYNIDVPVESKNKESKSLKKKGSKRITKTMIALAANFVNNGKAEERYEQIAGVSDLYKNSSFSILKLEERGIGVETIVYYRRETHYFIMTLKKRTLREHNLIKEDYDSLQKTLAPGNINQENLEKFAIKVANLSTNTSMDSENPEEHSPKLSQFHIAENGENNVAIFGYEALASASNSSKILQRKNKMLFAFLVGDSLIVPFWPEGTGVVKGFMSALDTCWVMKLWSLNETRITPLQLLGTKEYLYCHLRFMDKNGLIKKPIHFRPKLDPWCRYNRDSTFKKNHSHLRKLYDTDIDVKSETMEQDQFFEVLCNESTDKNYGIDVMLDWYNELLSMLDITVTDLTTSWRNGIALWAVIYLWEPSLIDWQMLNDDDKKNIQRAINILAIIFGIPPVMSAEDMAHLDEKDEMLMSTYLNKILNFITTNYNDLVIETKTRTKLTAEDERPPPPRKCLPGADKVKDRLGVEILNKIKCRMTQQNGITEEELIESDGYSEMASQDIEDQSVGDLMQNDFAKTSELLKTKIENSEGIVFTGRKETEESRSGLLKKMNEDRDSAEKTTENEDKTPAPQLESFIVDKSYLPPLINPAHFKEISLKHLRRSDSLPNMTVRMTTGECCVACNKVIHDAAKYITLTGKPIHKNCLRCSECDRRLHTQYYKFDENSRKFYCREHIVKEERKQSKRIPKPESDSDNEDRKKVLPRPSSMKLHYPEVDVKVTIIAASESACVTSVPHLEPDFRARSISWLQQNPKALNTLMKNSQVQDAVLEAAMKDPDLWSALNKALGNPNTDNSSAENLNFEENVQEESQYANNSQKEQLNETLNIFVKTDSDSSQTDFVDAINAFVETDFNKAPNTSISTANDTMEISAETNLANGHNSRVLNGRSNIVVKANSFQGDAILPRGTVATAVQRFNPEKNANTSPIYRTKSCPQLAKSKVSESCHYCQKRVYLTEKMTIYEKHLHRQCFKCQQCGVRLNLKTFVFDKEIEHFLCFAHSRKECVKFKKEKLRIKPTKDGLDLKNRWTPRKLGRKLTKVFRFKDHHDQLEDLIEDESTA